MIKLGDVYRLVEAMVPLYVALFLGYFSVKFWKLFTDDQCKAINRMTCFFLLPLFLFQYTSQIDPTSMNFRFLAADTISKIIVLLALAAWTIFTRMKKKDDDKKELFVNSHCYCWSITIFNVTTMISPLVIGAPLMEAVFGDWAVEYVVQAGLAQYIIWYAILLFAMEARRAAMKMEGKSGGDKDVEGGGDGEGNGGEPVVTVPLKFVPLMKIVVLKFIANPNFYASVTGIIWAYIAHRLHLKLPTIVWMSVMTLSRCATGISMFSIGLFMGCEKKILACGVPKTALVLFMKFIVGPAVTTIGAFMVGMKSDPLRVTILQAALPLAILSFIFAREYQVHPDVMGTMVTFGTLVSLPVSIAYYAVVEAF